MSFRPPADDRDTLEPNLVPPESGVRAGPMISLAGPLTIEREIYHRTWWTYRVQLPACLTAYWGTSLANWSILVTVSVLLSNLDEVIREPTLSELLRFLIFLANLIVPAWLQIGLNLSLLKIARGESVTFVDLFLGGRFLLTTVLATLMILSMALIPASLIYFGIENILSEYPVFADLLGFTSLLSASGVAEPILGSLNTLLASEWDRGAGSSILALTGTAVVGSTAILLLMARLGLFSFIVFDRGAGVVESLRESWKLTQGRAAIIIFAYVSQVLINLAGILAFCVGLVLTLPLTSLLMAMTYHVLSQRTYPAEPPTSEGWEAEPVG